MRPPSSSVAYNVSYLNAAAGYLGPGSVSNSKWLLSVSLWELKSSPLDVTWLCCQNVWGAINATAKQRSGTWMFCDHWGRLIDYWEISKADWSKKKKKQKCAEGDTKHESVMLVHENIVDECRWQCRFKWFSSNMRANASLNMTTCNFNAQTADCCLLLRGNGAGWLPHRHFRGPHRLKKPPSSSCS